MVGQYHMVDSRNRCQIITGEHWHRWVKPGALLVLSMIMSHLQTDSRCFPRASCSGSQMVKDDAADVVTWYFVPVSRQYWS